MKQAVIQQAPPGATGTQDWTDAVFSSDCKLALWAGARAASNNSATAVALLNLGCTDKTGTGVAHVFSRDAVSPTVALSYSHSSWAVARADVNSGSPTFTDTANLSGVSHPSTGIQVNWTARVTTNLFNCLLLGGANVSVSVKVVALNGTTPVPVDSGLTGGPDVIFAMTAAAANNTDGAGRLSKGFYLRSTPTYAASSSVWVTGANPSSVFQTLSTSWILAQLSGAGAVDWSATIGNFSGNSFDITGSAATTDQVILICIKGITAKIGFADTPTASGNASLGASLGVAPTFAILVPTMMASVGSASDDTANNVGLGFAVNNEGSTQQACATAINADNLATSDSYSYNSNTKCVVALGADGAPDVEAVVNAWQADDLQLAYTITGTPGAKKLLYLVAGESADTLMGQACL